MQRIRFWGTRGSLPVALTARRRARKLVAALRGGVGAHVRIRRRISSATSTACRSTSAARSAATRPASSSRPAAPDYVVCDLGSGLRPFGQAAIARHGPASPQTYHLFVSHLHWDHIMGLPFFGPAYIPGQPRCSSTARTASSKRRCAGRWSRRRFRSTFSVFNAAIEFVHLEPDRTHDVAGMQVTVKRQHHAGDSYGYRFERNGRVVVYSTDSEHKFDGSERERRASPNSSATPTSSIFDAMYSLAEAISVKADWGHSSNIVGVELCQLARGAAPVPVPSRAGARRRGARDDAGGNAALRGDHARRRSRCAYRPPTTGWN